MAMQAKYKNVELDYAYATGASEDGPTRMPWKYSNDVGNSNGNNNGGSHNHIGKGSKINNNIVDILDLAVPQSKVRPIDRLLDRYDWSSASMTPLLQDTDRPQRAQNDQPLSRPGRPAPSPPRRPSAPSQPPPLRPPPAPPARPPGRWASKFSDHKRPIRKSLWKRARELVNSIFVRSAATRSRVDCFWSH
ncbi:hypothetical protein QTP88_023516 [Uroleucon formosanum]